MLWNSAEKKTAPAGISGSTTTGWSICSPTAPAFSNRNRSATRPCSPSGSMTSSGRPVTTRRCICIFSSSLICPGPRNKLYIHRSTFINRMERIQELTHLNLEDYDTRLYLELSFRLLRDPEEPHLSILCMKRPLRSFGSNQVDFGGIKKPLIRHGQTVPPWKWDTGKKRPGSPHGSDAPAPSAPGMPPTKSMRRSVLGSRMPNTGSRTSLCRKATYQAAHRILQLFPPPGR